MRAPTLSFAGTAGVVIGLVLVVGAIAAAQDPDTPRASLDAVVKSAEAARAAGDTAKAASLYRGALEAHQAWAEGWWRFGTLLYDADDYAGAVTALERAAALDPTSGTKWVLLGLTEHALGRRDAALAHLQQGRALGIAADPQLRIVMLFHEGVLLAEKAEFEKAQDTLDRLAADGVDSEDLVTALGEAVLRIRPSELAAGAPVVRDMVARAGGAAHLAARKKFTEAQHEYERLAADYPTTKNVNYALGRFFVTVTQPDRAMAAYEREIAVTPDHVPARLGIAAIKRDSDPASALPYAEEAVRLNPRIPLGHYVLGTLLLSTPQVDRAIAELELAERDVKEDPGLYYALARAYTRAHRSEDAARARATFERLTEERQKAARRAAGETVK